MAAEAAIGGAHRRGDALVLFLAPTTRFNHSASPHRVFEACFHDLADFKRIKASCRGATINDVALAYVGGALRLYLSSTMNYPRHIGDRMPESIRVRGKKAAAATGCSAGCSRWTLTRGSARASRVIVAESAAFRDTSDSSSSIRLMDLVGLVPTTLLGLTVKAATAMPFSGAHDRQHHGEQRARPHGAVYFAGARLVRVTGLGPLIGGMNLFHVIASYHGKVSMCVTADRGALPDPGTTPTACRPHSTSCSPPRVDAVDPAGAAVVSWVTKAPTLLESQLRYLTLESVA